MIRIATLAAGSADRAGTPRDRITHRDTAPTAPAERVFAGVGGYYASKQSGLAGRVSLRHRWHQLEHALSEIEAFTVFVHPLDANLVLLALPTTSIEAPIAAKSSTVPTFPTAACRSGHSCMIKSMPAGRGFAGLDL
jgi:hypothetical protein